MGTENCFSLSVTLVFCLIGFVYYTVVFLVIEQWLSLKTAGGLMNALIFSSITSMALWSYILAILRDPGRVPYSYLPDTEDSQAAVHEVKRKGGDLRYCQKCSHYKPPRTHHCRTCKRCILRMDHHCIWINNCVGHNNYKAFFLFVLYAVLAITYALALLIGHGMQSLYDIEDNFKTSKAYNSRSTIIEVLCAIVLVPLLVALAVLLVWHIYLMLNNKTTIEYHEGVRARWLAEKSGEAYRHPYDLGAFFNIIEVLGPHATTWLCPLATPDIGLGLNFRTFCNKSGTDNYPV